MTSQRINLCVDESTDREMQSSQVKASDPSARNLCSIAHQLSPLWHLSPGLIPRASECNIQIVLAIELSFQTHFGPWPRSSSLRSLHARHQASPCAAQSAGASHNGHVGVSVKRRPNATRNWLQGPSRRNNIEPRRPKGFHCLVLMRRQGYGLAID
jgi:hypothetical protein